MATHDLKVMPAFFQPLYSKQKTFEIRRNDRDFKVGDVLNLREHSLARGYSGRSCIRRVTYLTDYAQRSGFVVLAVTPLES